MKTLQEIIDGAKRIVFFGGAGVSTESGIPDFRSADGLYNQQYRYPPETIISHSFFVAHPEEFYKFYRDKMLCDTAKPNAAHQKLAELEQEVRGSAYKIIAAKQATCYGIGMALARITKAIFEDEHSILTVSSLLEGEYSLGNVWLGTPCILGKEGIYGKLRLKLTDEETKKLKFSADVVAKNYNDALSSII